jgi:RNA polymerase sigma factor (sigma-70 family)
VSEEIVLKLARDPKSQKLWLEFFEKHRPAVYYSVYRASRGDRELAADLTQEAFFRFYRYADLTQFESDAHALAYLRQTARHLLISERAKSAPAVSSDPTILESIPDQRTAGQVELLELQHDLALLARQLNPEERQLLEAMIRGESLEVIAKRLNISYGAATTRVHRLRNKISIILKYLRITE